MKNNIVLILVLLLITSSCINVRKTKQSEDYCISDTIILKAKSRYHNGRLFPSPSDTASFEFYSVRSFGNVDYDYLIDYKNRCKTDTLIVVRKESISPESSIDALYRTDEYKKVLSDFDNPALYYVAIKLTNSIGYMMDIELSDDIETDESKYIYNHRILKDGIIKGYLLEANEVYIPIIKVFYNRDVNDYINRPIHPAMTLEERRDYWTVDNDTTVYTDSEQLDYEARFDSEITDDRWYADPESRLRTYLHHNLSEKLDYRILYLDFDCIVEKDGSLSNVTIRKPEESEYAKALIEELNNMPRWLPASINKIKKRSLLSFRAMF